jgi:hypothetical protein
MPEVLVERWYIELSYNNNNSPAYLDMIKDMDLLQNGVFNCTFKINDGTICDYSVTEYEAYAESKPSKTY